MNHIVGSRTKRKVMRINLCPKIMWCLESETQHHLTSNGTLVWAKSRPLVYRWILIAMVQLSRIESVQAKVHGLQAFMTGLLIWESMLLLLSLQPLIIKLVLLVLGRNDATYSSWDFRLYASKGTWRLADMYQDYITQRVNCWVSVYSLI